MAVWQGREASGCYKVRGVSYSDYEGYHNTSTRTRLKREDATLLSEAFDDSLEPDNLPGAFGEGYRRPRRERRMSKEERKKIWDASWKRFWDSMPYNFHRWK